MTLQHQELAIIKGLPVAKGDSNSAEDGQTVIDLLDTSGFSMKTDGWSPKVAGLKRGGIWSDNPATPGRSLITGAVGNVTEKMELTVKGASNALLAAKMANLRRMIDDARNFWEATVQVEPVYLKWWAFGAPGSQYALIYDIDSASIFEPFDEQIVIDLTLTIEREIAWRALPPGQNPRIWKFERDNKNYDTDDLHLGKDTDYIAYEATISNRHEWDPTDYLTPLTKNYIDIPAVDVPGDAPALLMVDMLHDTTLTDSHHIWLSTTPTTATTRETTPVTAGLNYIFNAGDSDGMAIVDNANGVLSDGSSVDEKIIQVASIDDATAEWKNSNGHGVIDATLLRGRYVVLLRYDQTSGSAGDLELRVQFKYNNTTATADTIFEELGPVDTVLAVTPWQVGYFGIVTIPPGTAAQPDILGRGPEVMDSNIDGLVLAINAIGSAAGPLEILDLILIKIDEAYALVQVDTPVMQAAAGEDDHWIIDNTGYLTHGKPDEIAMKYILTTATGAIVDAPRVLQFSGALPMLQPGVNNRLNFFFGSDEDDTLEARVSIVPRWYGVRDV